MANIETLAAETRYFAEVAAPATPSAGQAVIYVKTDGKIYLKDDAGTETDLTASGGAAPTYSAYTPTLTAASVNPTLGTGGSAAGRYAQTGKIVNAAGTITFGSSGTNAGSGEYRIALPVTQPASIGSNVLGTVILFDSSATRFYGATAYKSSTTQMRIAVNESAGQIVLAEANVFAWSAGDLIMFNITYEAA